MLLSCFYFGNSICGCLLSWKGLVAPRYFDWFWHRPLCGRVHCGVEPALKYRWRRTVIVGLGSCSKSLSHFNNRTIQLHNKTNYKTKPITEQNQLQNRINYRMHKLKTNPTTNQFNTNSESIQYQLRINSMLLPSLSIQCNLNSITKKLNPIQSITHLWVSGFKYRIFLGNGFLSYGLVSSGQPEYLLSLQSRFWGSKVRLRR